MKTSKTAVVAVAACLAALPAFAEKAKTATEYYMQYQAAFEKAKSVDDLIPFMPKESQEQIKKASAEEKKQGFAMMKAMGAKQVKVVKETATDAGATLDVEGVGGLDGGKMTGKVNLVKDASGWRIDKESWSAASTK
jgi:hypothetical protein